MSQTNKDNLKYALSYIPLVSFIFLFTEKSINKNFKKHINYGIILFLLYIILSFILKVLFLYILIPLLFLSYFGISLYLGFKAYNGDNINVDILDNIEEKISSNINGK